MNVSECWYFNSEQLCHGCLFTALSRVWVIDKLSTFIVDCSAYTSPAEKNSSTPGANGQPFVVSPSRSEWRCDGATVLPAVAPQLLASQPPIGVGISEIAAAAAAALSAASAAALRATSEHQWRFCTIRLVKNQHITSKGGAHSHQWGRHHQRIPPATAEGDHCC